MLRFLCVSFLNTPYVAAPFSETLSLGRLPRGTCRSRARNEQLDWKIVLNTTGNEQIHWPVISDVFLSWPAPAGQ